LNTLFGYPVIESDAMPTGTIVLADLSAYIDTSVSVTVEQVGDELIVTWHGVPEIGQEFTLKNGKLEIQMIVTGISDDGKTFSAARVE
jgi:hypothetical protein